MTSSNNHSQPSRSSSYATGKEDTGFESRIQIATSIKSMNMRQPSPLMEEEIKNSSNNAEKQKLQNEPLRNDAGRVGGGARTRKLRRASDPNLYLKTNAGGLSVTTTTSIVVSEDPRRTKSRSPITRKKKWKGVVLAKEKELIQDLKGDQRVSNMVKHFSDPDVFEFQWETEHTRSSDIVSSTASALQGDKDASSSSGAAGEKSSLLPEETTTATKTAAPKVQSPRSPELSSIKATTTALPSLDAVPTEPPKIEDKLQHLDSHSFATPDPPAEKEEDDDASISFVEEELHTQLISLAKKTSSRQLYTDGGAGGESFASLPRKTSSRQLLLQQEESVASMANSLHGPFGLVSPEPTKQRVVLDLAGMEQLGSPVRRKHAHVISSLQELVKKARVEMAVEKRQQSRKERMLRDMLETSQNWDRMHVMDSPPESHKPKLTMDEIEDIVNHINQCEEYSKPVRWDLINDIVGIEEEGDDGEGGGGEFSRQEQQQPLEHSTSPIPELDSVHNDTPMTNRDADKSETKLRNAQPPMLGLFPDEGGRAQNSRFSGVKKDHQAEQRRRLLSEDNGATAAETFQRQYGLTEEEMEDVIAHLNLCQETNTEVRWDLINRIICPNEDTYGSPQRGIDDTHPPGRHSSLTQQHHIDGLDESSSSSWFSIYPEFDDCVSEVTFLNDHEDTVPTAASTMKMKKKKLVKKGGKLSRDSLSQRSSGLLSPTSIDTSGGQHQLPQPQRGLGERYGSGRLSSGRLSSGRLGSGRLSSTLSDAVDVQPDSELRQRISDLQAFTSLQRDQQTK